jgi:hypothetical protein
MLKLAGKVVGKSISELPGNMRARVAPLSSARSALSKAEKAKKDADEAAAKASAEAAAAKIPKKSSEELQVILEKLEGELRTYDAAIKLTIREELKDKYISAQTAADAKLKTARTQLGDALAAEILKWEGIRENLKTAAAAAKEGEGDPEGAANAVRAAMKAAVPVPSALKRLGEGLKGVGASALSVTKQTPGAIGDAAKAAWKATATATAAMTGLASSLADKVQAASVASADYPAAAEILPALLDGATFANAVDFQAQALALYILTLQANRDALQAPVAATVPAPSAVVQAAKGVDASTDTADADPKAAAAAEEKAAADAAAKEQAAADSARSAADAVAAATAAEAAKKKVQRAQILMEFANYVAKNNLALPAEAYKTEPGNAAAETWNKMYESFIASTVTVGSVLSKAAAAINALSPTASVSDPLPADYQKKLNEYADEWDKTAANLFPARTRKFQEIYTVSEAEAAAKKAAEKEAKTHPEKPQVPITNEDKFEKFMEDYDVVNRKQQQEQTLLANVPIALTSLKTSMPESKSYGITQPDAMDAFTEAVENPLNKMLTPYGVALKKDTASAAAKPPGAAAAAGGAAMAGTSPLMPALLELLKKTSPDAALPASPLIQSGVAPSSAPPPALTEEQRNAMLQALTSDELANEMLRTIILSAIRKSGMSPEATSEFRDIFDRELADSAEVNVQAISAATQSARLAFEQSEAAKDAAGSVAETLDKVKNMLASLSDKTAASEAASADAELGTLQLQLTSVLQAASVAKLLNSEKEAAEVLEKTIAKSEALANAAAAAIDGANSAAAAAGKATADSAEALGKLSDGSAELKAELTKALTDSLESEYGLSTATKSALTAAMGTVMSADKLAAFQQSLQDKVDSAVSAASEATAAATASAAAASSDAAIKISEVGAKGDALNAQYANLQALLSGLQDTFKPAKPGAGTRGGWAMGGAAEAAPVAAPAAAPAAPGAPGAAASADTPDKYREYRKTLDQVKKDLRGVTDTLRGIQGSYEKFAENIRYTEAINDYKAAVANQNQAKRKDLGNMVVGMYKYLGAEGKAFVADVTSKLAEKKKVIVSAQERVQKILDTQPSYKNYIDMSIRMKNAIEGDYNAAEDSQGFLSQIDAKVGGLKTEYDTAFTEIKKIAEGVISDNETEKAKYAALAQQRPGVVGQQFANPNMATQEEEQRLNAEISAVSSRISGALTDYEQKAESLAALAATAADAAKAAKDAADAAANPVAGADPDALAAAAKEADAKAKAAADAKAKADAAAAEAAKADSLGLADLREDFGKIKDAAGSDTNTDRAARLSKLTFFEQKLEPAKTLFASKDTQKALAEPAKSKGNEFAALADSIEKLLMRDIVVMLDETYRRKLDPTFAAATSSSPAGEPGILTRIYNQYLDDKQTYNQNPVVAAMKLTESLRSNNMLPREVLKVSAMDKTVFIFVTLFIRLISLSLAGYMIDRGTISRMQWALATFLMIYIFFFVGFVLLVNLDTYRLRIVFNYINFQANAGNVYAHLTSLVIFSLLIFIIMWNVNFPVPGMKLLAISDEEKAQLVYRLEVLTMIVWMFLTLIVIVT